MTPGALLVSAGLIMPLALLTVHVWRSRSRRSRRVEAVRAIKHRYDSAPPSERGHVLKEELKEGPLAPLWPEWVEVWGDDDPVE